FGPVRATDCGPGQRSEATAALGQRNKQSAPLPREPNLGGQNCFPSRGRGDSGEWGLKDAHQVIHPPLCPARRFVGYDQRWGGGNQISLRGSRPNDMVTISWRLGQRRQNDDD